uniref:FP protein C-terminal domain-containing protein n=1 Tax=Cacopsylla melanoneura TaxID=428564 RepID=A0A8D9EVI4_9HEMI
MESISVYVQNGVQSSNKLKTKEKNTESNMVASGDGEGDLWTDAMNEAEQQNRLKNVIVSGIVIRRVHQDESLMRSVEQIGRKLGIKYPLLDVQMARRIFLPDKTKGAIVIQLKSTLIKENWILKYRKGGFWRENWYMNEHLTKQNFNLFKLTKIMARNQRWNYVWTRFCRIYMRKNEGTKIYQVTSPENLYSILNIKMPKEPPKPKKLDGRRYNIMDQS